MNKLYKAAGAILGAIILGAIGSGVWQYMLDPIFKGGTKFILELATLGVESYKDDLYVEVSKGFQETASYRVQALFNIMLAMVFIAISVGQLFKVKDLINSQRRLLDEVNYLEKGEIEEHYLDKIKQFRSELQLKKPEKLVNLSYICILLSALIASLLSITTVSDKYIHSAVVHYHQSLKIISPYINKYETLKIESDFAKISTSSDYANILNKIETIANENNEMIRDFDIW